eukprot:TRINITY_DN162_c0_g1_i2.p1 TRINITY_DN162_c0_g1~~TRINITY_DN162_c0_g1_i2.p1  ORF type:complete len:129 (+),score=28.96 TRINITY_DN162_c0_g1_i2:56-442(+)
MAGERTDADFKADYDNRQRAVNNKLNMGQGADALKEVLADPPLGCKNQQIKDDNTELVLSVLTSVKDADIEKAISSLNPTELDVLMKYIYKGLVPGDKSTSLLKWHAAVTKKGGLGCIVRALAERRTV